MDFPQLCQYCFMPFTGFGACPHCGHTVGEPRKGAQQLPLGTILDGKYQLGMVLGQGGFGITYLAYDLTLHTRVAIKEYFPLGLVTRQTQIVTFSTINAQSFFQKGEEAFYREAQLLVRFQNHPNIVHVSNFFRQNGTAYFVMEYIEGESLSAYLDKRGGQLTYDETIQLLSPIFDALFDIHNTGILHRDIAPDNIFMAKDGNIKLIDFGAAKNELGQHTHSSAAILKPGYAPLEQYTSGSNQGPWTDIYAMGAVIYRCLTGTVPPDAPNRITGQSLMNFREAGIDVPAGAEAAIAKALALDIPNRWQNIIDFKKTLIDPAAMKNNKPQTQERGRKQKTRKPWIIPVLAIAVVFLIIGFIFSQIVIPKEQKYREGTSLISDGQYEEALQILDEIGQYKDTEQQIRLAKSLWAEELLALDDYDQALQLFTELSGENYASERIAGRKAEYALLFPPSPEPTEVLITAEETPSLAPESLPEQNELQRRLASANTGDIITFGHFEQDGNDLNGKEPIDWIVLEKQEDKVLLLSQLILDKHTYHRKNEKVTWETCDLRNWLNNEFINTAFTNQEQLLLLETEIITPDFDAGTIVYPDGRSFHNLYLDGSVVMDRCFILSYEEIEFYLDNNLSNVMSSEYVMNHEYSNSDYWYIRSGNCNQIQHYRDFDADLFFSPIISNVGTLGSTMTQANKGYEGGIRPAIWIKYQ